VEQTTTVLRIERQARGLALTVSGFTMASKSKGALDYSRWDELSTDEDEEQVEMEQQALSKHNQSMSAIHRLLRHVDPEVTANARPSFPLAGAARKPRKPPLALAPRGGSLFPLSPGSEGRRQHFRGGASIVCAVARARLSTACDCELRGTGGGEKGRGKGIPTAPDCLACS
jgi:hypothetical protein